MFSEWDPTMRQNFDVEKTLGPEVDRHAGELKAAQEFLAPHDRQCDTANARPMRIEEIVAELFKYHPPTPTTLPKFAAINQAAKNFAEVVLANCPGGQARVNAVESIVLARMLANQAIALNGLAISY